MSGVTLQWLTSQARRLRLARAVSETCLGAAAAVLATATVFQLTGRLPTSLSAGLAIGLLAALGSIFRPKRWPLTPAAVAGHVNRSMPEAEESAHLLLQDPASLPLLARLQRARAEHALRSAQEPTRLPDARRSANFRAAGLMAGLGLLLLLLPRAGTGSTLGGPPDPRSPALRPSSPADLPTITGVEVVVSPPRYTGRAPRRSAEWDAEVEEGATIRWQLAVTGEVGRGRLITATGDTVELAAQSGNRFEATLVAHRSTLYRVLLEAPDGREPPAIDHRLVVVPDAPPVLTVVAPEQRTEIWPGDALRLAVQVLANDDHGVDSIALVATVTKGQGEGVKFREQSIPFAERERRDGNGLLLRQSLDLAALGLEPGDELYFHVQATDRRSPAPNMARSETIFVTMVDTARGSLGPGAGVTLNLPPDFFRSQRQLIIDTERLLVDRPRLARPLFQSRSNDLGLDQGLLRLRYGQFMGDEFEGELVASGREAHADHDADEPPPEPVVDPITGVATVDPQAELLHDHDDPENATLLAPEVKARLRDAISAMWSAELQLRLGEPRRSLPFQHRALELLQEIRQDARSYVRRVGFDPPPLEPDRRRLAGDLSRIRLPAVTRTADPVVSHPELRAGLATVQRLRQGGGPRAGDADQLERAGQELGRLAVDDPAHLLEPLRALRRAIASLAPGAEPCADCWPLVEQGFWRALPDAAPEAGAPAGQRPALADRYFRLLDRRP